MMRANGVLIFALALCGACNVDPPLDVAPNVDLTRFQGKWYEIARLPRVTQTDCYGTTAFYSPSSDGSLTLVHQCNVGAATGPLDTVSMTATVPDRSVAAKLSLAVGGYVGDYWILEVGPHYEYAVVGHPSRSYLWVLSRTPTLDDATYQGALTRAQNNHFDVTKLEQTPQPPAGERVSSSTPVGPVPPAVSTGCSMGRTSPTSTWATAGGLGLLLAAIQRRRESRRRARRVARRAAVAPIAPPHGP